MRDESQPDLRQPSPPVGAIPRVEAPVLVRQARSEERSAPHPLYVVWEITLKCDLGCKHCGSRAGHERTEELSTEACLDVVAQMHDLGIREVTLIGGEAYLREDWDVIAAEITRRGMVCGITTGARNLTDERVARAVDAGVRTISVSIDGLEQTHDAQRGARGSFRSAVDALERIARTPMRLANNTQINRLSLPELPALADLLGAYACKAWQIQLTVPMGRGADRTRLLLQPWELLTLYPLLVWIKERKLDGSGVTLFPGNNIGYFGPYEGALRYNGASGAHWGGCPAGEWSLGLEADGKIKACPSLPSGRYTGGNLKTDLLADTVQHAEEITFLKSRTRADLWGYCRTCYYADVCKAGCTWTSQVFMGRPGNNPYCIHRAVEHERQGLRERFTKVADAPGLPFDQGRFELLVEALPPAESQDVCGFPLERIVAHDWREGSLWTESQIAEVLAPDRAARIRGLRVI